MKACKFEEKVAEYAKEHDLCEKGSCVIVTLSGGADSVALLYVLLSIGVECRALHCNFHLRGEESDRDEAFVRKVCEKLDVPLKVRHFDVKAYEKEHKVSTEMACRELRYAWFEEERMAQGACQIAVAHHHDDSVETFFLNMMRGTGIQGLTGIRVKNGHIVRPLLCVTRAEIESYLLEKGQDYVTDSTNLENDFKRNKIRNVVIPLLNELFPEYVAGVTRTLQNVQGCNDFYQEAVLRMHNELVDNSQDDLVKINLAALRNVEQGRSTAVYELIKEYGYNSQDAEIMTKCIDEINTESHIFISKCCEGAIKNGVLELRCIQNESSNEYKVNLNDLLKEDDRNMEFMVSIEQKYKGTKRISGIDGRKSIALNVRILEDNPCVVIRSWKKGDTMCPYGMNGNKLISDIFTDNKYTIYQKQKTRILTTADNDTILWVMNLRASRHYAVNADDEIYLKLMLKD